MMRAAWWWIDRWRKSTAYTDMTAEQQGVYRNLLDELWLRDGALPKDERILAKIGGDFDAWPRVRQVVLARFVEINGHLRNETHDEVAKGTKDFRASQAEKGRKGAAARWHKVDGPANGPAISPANDLPSPSPSLVSIGIRMPDSCGGNPPANPFIPPGGRASLESECLNLVRRMSELTGEDALEIIARASGYEGAKHTKLNPASMTDDRLLNTLRDLRADVAIEEKKHAEKHT
jgi:uncharacterized protein YdaU (DUF1376 family)